MKNSKQIGWGILGTGYVAREFAQSLSSLKEAKLVGVGSRQLTSAQDFAHRYGFVRAYGSYEELVADGEVDVVYIATPNDRHRDDCLLCLDNGKAVLCEKPFALNAQQAQEVVSLARRSQLFCMEAMWMRFMPLVQKSKNLVSEGIIGDPCLLVADFGAPVEQDPENRFYNPSYGGGALLDRGIYLISLAYWLMGSPANITGTAKIGNTGVDDQCAFVLNWADGKVATLSATLTTRTSNEAVLYGTGGSIRIHEPFIRPHRLSILTNSTPSVSTSSNSPKRKLLSSMKQSALINRFRFYLDPLYRFMSQRPRTEIHPIDGNGYQYEAAEVMRCLSDGCLESPIMPLDETISIMKDMDNLREKWISDGLFG